MILKCKEHQCRWHRRKEARPEEILDAALDLFTEKGFNATRMVDVAKQAGVSKGTLYLYFESKELLLQELVRTMISPMVDEAEEVINQFQGNSAELLDTMVTGWWESFWHNKLSAIPKLIVSEAGNFPDLAEFYVDTIVKRVRGLFEKIIQQGISAGEFNPVNHKEAARLLMAPVIQASIWKFSLKPFDDDFDEKSYIKLHLSIFLNGLKRDEKNAK
ncbi:MAG: TetR/AcrR family transcriptional regulator [Gammaproteobacteria bacterium]|nr:TetR/AcrR family transcriptional regulator [Gammaproteobacteria bacterium]